MVALPGADLVLFVAGEPDSGAPSPRDVTISMSSRILGSVVPLAAVTDSGLRRSGSAGSEGSPSPRTWRLPPQQIHCVNAVLDIARREGRTVTVIDVDHAAARQHLVDRWVGPDDVVPLLVRPDGARLEGLENFGGRTLRRFIRGT
jgi:hypothetical protein